MLRNYFCQTLEGVGSPPVGWEIGHVTLHLIHPEEKAVVEAWRRGAFAVHPADGCHGVITHAPTGRGLWTARSMGHAAKMVEAIEPLADWQTVQPGINPALRDRTRKIIDEFEAAECGEHS